MTESVPKTPTEIILVNIWREVFGVKEVAIGMNFMDSGGDSLAATRCLARIRRTFRTDISLEIFFSEDSSIRDLASHIDKREMNARVETC